jgi:hypothetical protein
MSTHWLWLVTFAPLVVFVIVDFYSGMRSGVVSAVVAALSAFCFFWFWTGEIDWESLGVIIVMCLAGVLAVRTNNPVFFKLQPVVTGGVLVLYFGYCQFFDAPFLVRTWPKLAPIVPPPQAQFFASPEGQEFLAFLSLNFMLWTCAHTALVAWSAVRCGNLSWIIIKGLALPFILLGSLSMVLAQGFFGF